MKESNPADYVAAAIAYALLNRPLEPTADVRDAFIRLLRDEYKVAIPREVVLPALRILARGGVLELEEDKYLPLVRVPDDVSARTAKFRYLDREAPASDVLHRFMDGPHDWMASVLKSQDFRHDVEVNYPGEKAILPHAPVGAGPSEELESSALATAAIQNAQNIPIQVTIHNSNQQIITASDQNDSSTRASWFSAWGTWAAAVVALAALLWALNQAKVF